MCEICIIQQATFPWWRQFVVVAATTMGESEFWVLILEEGKERVSFGFKGRRSK